MEIIFPSHLFAGYIVHAVRYRSKNLAILRITDI